MLLSMYYLFLFRGHTVNAVCESFQGAKDAGFKVVAHMMPDLPNVGLERDIEQFIVSTKIFGWYLYGYKADSNNNTKPCVALHAYINLWTQCVHDVQTRHVVTWG